jgi:hypothetical protein
MPVCSNCKADKLPEEFGQHDKALNGLQSQCKECKKLYANKNQRKRWLQTEYRITEDEYLRLYEEQQGCCAICKRPQELLHVDHCHETSVIRGLLCETCNRALGSFKDNVLFLKAAIEYLEKPRPLDLARVMLLLEKESRRGRKRVD